MDNIERLAQELAQVFYRIEERRNHWHTITRDLILTTLKGVAERFPIFDWTVDINEAWQNMESAFISFNFSPSGIIEKNPTAIVQKMKKGGLLSFSQSRNGQIVTWVAYPFIDGITADGPKNSTLDTVEPEEINEEYVHRFIEKFLEEMIGWENDAREEIGFVKKHHR
ncbi:hypothetical protein [Chitinophaga sp. Cy-1792]|uniref:hypothetical protein n=1 Tax=Chitinophaga sp. Cy-1792 TaxID=2608339 RepID=UPI001420056A|nr:hypothetical protein [Chitinophaga sp. Cy-1792]NIG52367.1 hypothetical protein [Chitinophaga sp. Cy-1792]